jgi:phage terminase large subunit
VATINDLVRTILNCKLPNPRGWYISPTYSQSKKVAWTYLKDATAALPGYKANEAELRVDFLSDYRVQLAGADNPDSLRGIYADGVVMDEFAFMAGDIWSKIIRPALADRGGVATFISSVNGRNEFYRLYQQAMGSPEEWFSTNLKAEATGVIDPKELKSLKREMSEEDYAQEFCNDFDVAAKGSYYGKLISAAEADGRICGVPCDGAALVHTAWDLGYGDSTAIWFLQEVGREIHAIDYYEASGQPLSHYAAVVKSKGYEYDRHILPHDASAKRLEAGGKTMVDMLGALGLKDNNGRISVAPQMTVDTGIAAVRAMLPKTWFDASKCADGIEKLRQYRSSYDEKRQVLSNTPLHDFTSHCADALRMYAVAYRQKTRPQASEVEQPLRWL